MTQIKIIIIILKNFLKTEVKFCFLFNFLTITIKDFIKAHETFFSCIVIKYLYFLMLYYLLLLLLMSDNILTEYNKKYKNRYHHHL